MDLKCGVRMVTGLNWLRPSCGLHIERVIFCPVERLSASRGFYYMELDSFSVSVQSEWMIIACPSGTVFSSVVMHVEKKCSCP
jgi:hypothetical protein